MTSEAVWLFGRAVASTFSHCCGTISDMFVSSKNKPSSQHRASLRILNYAAIYLCMLGLLFRANFLHAQDPAPAGIAWRVIGAWQVDGKGARISAGDAIRPGSLLQPSEEDGGHSITVFLADGRSILYECFNEQDCARGFRVPTLTRIPDPVAVDLLARIHANLVLKNSPSSIQPEPGLPRDEVLATLDPDNRFSVKGLAANLPNGRYTYDIRPLNDTHPAQFPIPAEKTKPEILISLPAPGLYDLIITDDLKTPRIDLLIAAVNAEQATIFRKSFHQVQALMTRWNESGFGWPVHDFQRAYLESLVQDSLPRVSGRPAVATAHAGSNARTTGEFVSHKAGANDRHLDGVTAEPMFSPQPGVFPGDIAVFLRCKSPGASIHFTVDSSEPMANSPVYAAPIIIKGTGSGGLTIRAFASARGKRDSAVVTGIYRIQDR
jgi:hypothetical protein